MFLLRHGQSYFNLYFNKTRVDPGIEDPELTPLGLEQAAAAALQLAHSALTHIIISPFTRALQTAQPILAMHRASVRSCRRFASRPPLPAISAARPMYLTARFPHHDFGHLPPRWWHDGIETLKRRFSVRDAFRALMAARGDSATTLLVGHWAFIQALTGVSLANGEIFEYDLTPS